MAVAAGYGSWLTSIDVRRVRPPARARPLLQRLRAASRPPEQLTDAVRASRDSIALGFKIAGDWPVKEDLAAGKTVINTLVGIAVAAIGYTTLQKVYEQAGDTAMAQQTAAEYEALKQRKKAYTQAVFGDLNNAVYESY